MSNHDKTQQYQTITITAWKSHSLQQAARSVPWILFGFFLLIGLIVLGERRDAQYAPIFFLLGAVSLITGPLQKRYARTVLQIGLDRSNNQIRIVSGKGADPLIVERADQLEEFGWFKEVTRRTNYAWQIGSAMPIFWTTTRWLLTCRYRGKQHHEIQFTVGFSSAPEAEAAIRAMQKLLSGCA
jgi:hypothetical protein